MSRITMGIYSGVMGTIVLGAMLLMNNALHGIPEVHVASTLADIMGETGHTLYGVAAILVIGIFICGGAFVALAPKLPLRSFLGKSLVFAAASWLLTMVVVMPLGGDGFFGLKGGGPIVPESMLVLILAYWLAFGVSYRWLVGPQGQPSISQAS